MSTVTVVPVFEAMTPDEQVRHLIHDHGYNGECGYVVDDLEITAGTPADDSLVAAMFLRWPADVRASYHEEDEAYPNGVRGHEHVHGVEA